MKKILIPLTFLLGSFLYASIASDNASNYGGGWPDGSNQGSGFANWSLNNNNAGSIFAGNFIGDSTSGAGNINTSGDSFGLFANPSGAFSTAIRSFSTLLNTGDTFSFQMALNFDNGAKGFNLRTAGDSIFNFNVGGGGSVSSANATLVPGSGAGYDYGGNDAVIDITLSKDTATSITYDVSRTSSSGFQGTLFSGSVNGITNPIDNFEFYVSGTDDGSAQNNLYFNNLEVVPEPASIIMLGLTGLAAGGMTLLKRRKRS